MRFTFCLGLALLTLGQPAEIAAQGAGANWPTYGGDYSAWRYSRLEQINADNVKQMVPVWAFQTGDYESGLQSTPIVVDGVMYVSTGTNLIYALDAASGEIIWQYEYDKQHPISAAYFRQNRGVAVGHGLVFIGTVDNSVLAVDQKTGREVWRVRVQDPAQCGCNISAAPLLVKDLVVVGGTGGDFAHRGSLTAFHAKTGRFAWRFYITPAPGEPGNETWAGDSWRFGGGSPWMTGSYDPDLDLIFWGTGNAAPGLDGAAREGDNLYTAPAYTVVSASSKMLGWRSSRLVQVTRAADVGVRRRSVLSSETEEGLEGCHWGLAAVVSKHELIEVNLKLSAAHAVVRSGQPLLQVANGTIRQRHHRLGAFPQVSPVRLRTRDVFVAGLFEGGKGLQTVCVDGRAGNNVLGKKPVDRHLLEVWNNGHANAPGALPAFLNSDHHKGRTAPLQLPAASQTCLRAANPGVIDLYFSVQGLASCVHHGPSQFVQHHPGGFVARQAELTLQ